VEGFVPTGWYPTLVRATPDGKRLLIGSGKGVGTGPNKVKRPIDEIDPKVSFLHHGHNLNGLVSFVDMPNAKKLSAYTKQVYENTPYKDALLESAEVSGDTVIPVKVGRSPIEHVLYIMKENRTYDRCSATAGQRRPEPDAVRAGRRRISMPRRSSSVLLDNSTAAARFPRMASRDDIGVCKRVYAAVLTPELFAARRHE
jgi:hypothetical protein